MQHGLHGKFGRDLWRIEQVGFVHLSNSSKHNNLVVHSDIFYDDDLDDFFHKYSIFNYNHVVLSTTTPLHLQPVLVLRQLQRRLPLPRREFMAPLCTMRSQDKFANNEIATTTITILPNVIKLSNLRLFDKRFRSNSSNWSKERVLEGSKSCWNFATSSPSYLSSEHAYP
jgi:hypothetical protein